MLHVILHEPEIPPNTGNIIRLCANTGTQFHLIEPLGFTLDDARLRRAGLDYREWARVEQHTDWRAFRRRYPDLALWTFSTRGTRTYVDAVFGPDDGLVFGPESRGLPAGLLEEIGIDRALRLPMQARSRSLNLSNTVAVGLYEALRQQAFGGLV